MTLDNAVYMGMKNDLSFLLDTHIYLYEHQSTKNPNMPLRDLFYISLEYQKYVSDKSLYSSTPAEAARTGIHGVLQRHRGDGGAHGASFVAGI